MTFVIEEIDRGATTEKVVADSSREVIVRYIGAHSRGEVLAFLLEWQQRAIPFEASLEFLSSEPGTKTGFIWRFADFGHSSVVQLYEGLGNYQFSDEAERAAALILAAEALLVFGGMFDGLTRRKTEDIFVALDNRLYSFGDFGL